MIKGEFATIGFVSYLKKPPAEENSVAIDICLEAGAVLYVKTTVPQTLMVGCITHLPSYHLNSISRSVNHPVIFTVLQ